MARHTTRSAQQTMQLARSFAQGLRGGELIAFSGGLGAGKTSFCVGIADALGATDPVSSPTFAIVNYYEGRIPFAHFDAWRISSPDDLEASGFYDYLEQGAVVAVEWFENIAAWVPQDAIRVDIRVVDKDTREITITHPSPQ